MRLRAKTLWLISALIFGPAAWAALPLMDLAPFGQISSFGEHDEATALTVDALRNGGLPNAGVEWREERDVNEIRVRFSGRAPEGIAIEYWFHTWPFSPPQMPSIEDPVDDRWQGKWLTASVEPLCRESECVYRFAPLSEAENPNAAHQPGLSYRRTLKIRLRAPGPLPPIEALQAFSGTTEKQAKVRVCLGFREKEAVEWTGSMRVHNGRLQAIEPWRFSGRDKIAGGEWTLRTQGGEKGFDLDLIAAAPTLPGSLDETLVTVNAVAKTPSGTRRRGFTFRIADLQDGPVYIPDFAVYVTTNLQSTTFEVPKGRGERIRTMIPREPEQSYERASREIPPQDPWVRQWPGPLYLPLAVDASWQKFAFEIGGNPFISKDGTKAMGRELRRLQWNGDELKWMIGTGSTPYYREDKQATMSPLDGYLPVVTQKWKSDGFEYEQEAFATLLRGPIDPSDPQRSEETPAILMMTLRFRNTSGERRPAHIWLSTLPAEELELRGEGVYAMGGGLRALVQGAGPAIALDALPGGDGKAAHLSIPVAAGASGSIVLKLPFVSDLSAGDIAELSHLDIAAQRSRVASYWREVTAEATRFSVPEPNFNLLVKGVPAHIRLSATKDPVSGMFMLPAASYIYKVYANETCFQTLLLDSLGQHKLAEAYLEPIIQLQGTKGFPGKHEGMEDAIFHGVHVSDEYEYTASTYGLDHGTVLWTLGEHYLYTRDRAWFERVWPHMRKAIDWIVTQRRSTMKRDAAGNPVPEYGLLPASSLEDNSDWAHWFANNSFSWAGLDRAARALEDLKHPEAARVRKEADAYRADLRSSILRATEAASVTKLRDGSYTPWVPVEPFQRLRRFGPIRVDYYHRYGITEQPNLRLSAIREVLYGPIIYLNLGVFRVDEPIAEWILDDWEDNMTLTSGLGLNVHGLTDDKLWFSQGGMVFQSNLQNPWLVYLKRHDTEAAIRCAYNNFVACFYPGPNVLTEEYRAWSHASGPFYKSPDEAKFVNRLRDMLVLESDDALWLANGIPRRWFASSEGVRVDRVTTYFGDVSYTLRGTEAGVIEGEVTLPSRNRARENWISVRVPEGRIRSVTLDGQEWNDVDRKREAIRLPNRQSTIHVRVRYR